MSKGEKGQDDERAAMRLFEQVRRLPVAEHEAFLAQQHVSAQVLERVNNLLRAESLTGDVLDTCVMPPSGVQWLPDLPKAGDRLGHYELLRPLAAGGMGVVYLARRADDVYQQEVAIKLIRAVHLMGDATARASLIARFEAERRILAQLQHPNIARILDGGSTESGFPYLVMEYVDGMPLSDFCNQRRLGVKARLELLCRVCDGVQEAHRHLIVHRDIKPDNILVTPAGEPRLIDFGIARELEAESGGSAQTGTLHAAMTPAYASPEQVRHEALTTSSDVYSLGIVLFQLITDRRPYELAGLSPAAIERLVSTQQVPSLREALKEADMDPQVRRHRLQQVGSDLERILDKALHKDAQRRYHSAEALADDLRRYLAGHPVAAHPDSLGYRLRKFVSRHRAGVGVASLSILGIVMAALFAGHQAQVARQALADTERANRFLVDVLNLSDPYSAGGELSLGEAMARAYGLVDEQFADRPEMAADLRLTLSEGLLHSGRVSQAGEQLEALVEQFETAFGAESPKTVKALLLLASTRREQGRYAEAERLYQTSLLRIERGQWRDDILHARALNDLGLLYLTQEKYAEAATSLRQAIALDEKRNNPNASFASAQTRVNLAQALRGQGKLDQADALYAQAQAIFEAEYPEGSPQTAIVLNSRANLARRRDQFEQALALQRESVEMHRRSFSGDHVMVLVPTINLARQYVDMDRAEEALPYAQRADAMARRLYPEPHNYRIQATTALADAWRAAGDFTQADDLLQEAERLQTNLELPPSTREYVQIVRADLCEQAPELESCH